MAIRVMIKRWVTPEKEKDLVSLITELRSMVSKQPGYISGETMRHVSNPDEYLVISTWDTLEDCGEVGFQPAPQGAAGQDRQAAGKEDHL